MKKPFITSKWILSLTRITRKTSLFIIGLGALIWFLIRVIPKPSRATYPCQQAAFPIASAFVVWLTGTLSSLFALKKLKKAFAEHRFATSVIAGVSMIVLIGWLTVMPNSIQSAFGINTANDTTFVPAKGFDWTPGESNKPVGIARGIYPGRVVMSKNPEAAKWAGKWRDHNDQWWLDKNTDVEKVSEMLSVNLQKLTGAKNDQDAWEKIFQYYNKNTRGLKNKGYTPNEIVAIKINLNNSSGNKSDNLIDASPQSVLAMVRQLVNEAHVPQDKIIVYDARRTIAPAILTEVWREFKDVRFVQEREAGAEQPNNPAYGNHHGIEASDWQEGLTYSAGNFREAKQIPRQIIEATYLVNLAILKTHSYPYNFMEDSGDGETGISMSGKNHFGSIKAPWELHAIINPHREARKNEYSPLVDMASSPNLGGKTILFVLDGLYSGRKWKSYPIHFPNPPFNNKATPYENPEWPSCMLASLDEVALESVGLDIMYAQSKNNVEPTYHNVPRIMFRACTDDFLYEMATPDKAPSGTKYIQGGKPVKSLGVHEHWDNDQSMRYSRNLDPKKGSGIEFIYIPLGSLAQKN
ncbi:MAG: DUF362 domain-containing protein [Bacteroidota bacterium]|nr:DUF362 domain-containing protein [Bacteroidota bacterium]